MMENMYEVLSTASLVMMWLATACNVVSLISNVRSKKKWERMMKELSDAMVALVAQHLVEDLFQGDEQRFKDGDVDPEKVLDDAIEKRVCGTSKEEGQEVRHD